MIKNCKNDQKKNSIELAVTVEQMGTAALLRNLLHVVNRFPATLTPRNIELLNGPLRHRNSPAHKLNRIGLIFDTSASIFA